MELKSIDNNVSSAGASVKSHLYGIEIDKEPR